MKDDLQQYFIAVLPPDEISSEARRIQDEFHTKYNTKAALRSPPHITLHMPFRWKAAREEVLTSKLSQFFHALAPFSVVIEGFGSFPPRVIYMNVISSKELVEAQYKLSRFCRLHLGLFNATHCDHPYHPHLTLAFRDLRKPTFKVVWELYSKASYAARFDVESVWLLRHDGHKWHPLLAFDLDNTASE